MKSQGLACTPSAVANLKGDEARAAFITHFKEVQRLKTQLDQYTDLTEDNKATIEQVLPEENLRGFKGQYLETAKKLKEPSRARAARRVTRPGTRRPRGPARLRVRPLRLRRHRLRLHHGPHRQVLGQGPGKSKMTREELIGLISADAKFMNERDDIAEYIGTLKAGEGLSETAIREGYTRFKAEKNAKELAAIAAKHGLATAALQTFVDGILDRMIFDGEQLSDLMAPLDLGWKARTQAELALMADLYPPSPPHQTRRWPRHLRTQRV
jgi:type I restriction enzyme R subunit